MNSLPKIYYDTSALAPNVRNDQPELEALKRLRELWQAGKCSMRRAHIVQGELERTADVELAHRSSREGKAQKVTLSWRSQACGACVRIASIWPLPDVVMVGCLVWLMSGVAEAP